MKKPNTKKMGKPNNITIYMKEDLKKKIQDEAKRKYLDTSSYIRFILGEKLNEPNQTENVRKQS